MKGHPNGREGFSMVELVVSLAFLLVTSVSVGFALHTGVRVNREVWEAQLLQANAQTFINRMVQQNFGEQSNSDPASADIEAVFNPAVDPGDVSLVQLSRYPTADGGWRFTLRDFPIQGEWRVVVDSDLNGDGSQTSDLEQGRRVFGIRVFFNDELILSTSRAKEVSR